MRTFCASVMVLALLAGALFATRSFTLRAERKAASARALPHLPPKAALLAATLPQPGPAPTAAPAFEGRSAIGRKIFFDPAFSEPAGTSCAACHDPDHGYSGVNGSERGVARGSRPGHFARRTAPSTMYLRFVPRFRIEWDDESDLPEGHGGFFWDGRASSLAELVRQPLLNPDEMANPSLDAIAQKLAKAPYAREIAAEFEGAFATTESALEALGFCLEAFLTSRALSPFSSRYDDYVRGEGQLSPLELRGLALFKDSEKGACNSCHHLDDTSTEVERSLFTDFGYDSVAAPRNAKLALPAGSFDLGLCERHDARLHTDDPWYCGAFRTPSLRNVALRPSFFHNGTFSSLREVVRFYAVRGSTPEAAYPHAALDDLPAQYWQYVNTTTPPYNRQKGDAAALDDAEIDAIVAFLGTLTDRQIPPRP
jgi:cytochrome c peroxidase